MGEDRTPPQRRTTVAEAAEILGISAEAVRGRIRRGTLSVERESGTVYVLLEEAEQDRTTADQPRTTGDQPDDRTDLLITELQDRVRSLEEANRENRRIIAALTSRIPQLEAPSEARESPETVDEQQGRSHSPTPMPQALRRAYSGRGGVGYWGGSWWLITSSLNGTPTNGKHYRSLRTVAWPFRSSTMRRGLRALLTPTGNP